jgi:hypothetical protein
MVVIPAKAGIQFKYVVRSTHDVSLCCVLRTPCFYWIPAFAGMTTAGLRHTERVASTGDTRDARHAGTSTADCPSNSNTAIPTAT